MISTFWILAVIISLIFCFIFAGSEMAFITANKLQIELQKKTGSLSGKILSVFFKAPSMFIGATLIGNTIGAVVYGIAMAAIIQPVMLHHLPAFLENEAFIVTVETLISTTIIIFAAEFLPKALFLRNPIGTLSLLSVPLIILYYLMMPIVWVLVGISKWLIKYVLRQDYIEEKHVLTITDLNNYIKTILKSYSNQKNQLDDSEVDAVIFHNALEFKTARVRDCMVPRTELTAIELDGGIVELKKTFLESKHSKVLVFEDSIDNIIGYCHSLALFKKPKSLKSIMKSIPIVQETMMAHDLMIKLKAEQRSMAVVVDEFGGTSGIVCIEDVIEEIFGEIDDEHDAPDDNEQKIEEENLIFSGRSEIEYLNHKFGLNIPEGDYETLGGFIINNLENLPEENEIVHLDHLTITIISREDNKINKVKIQVDVK